MAEKKARRRKGEGSIGRHHNHPSCPPVIDGERAEHKCKGLWRARVIVTVRGKKVPKTLYGKSEPEVVAKKAALLLSESQGRITATGKKPTVAEWIEEWFADAKQDLKVNTWQGYRNRINVWIIPQLGHIRIDRLTDEDIEGLYRTMRRKGLAEGSVHQVHAILRRSLTVARRRKLIAVNPCEDVEPPSQKPKALRRPLTVEECWKVLAAAGDDPRYWVALMTGLRQGEACALRWSDLRLDGSPVMAMPHLIVTQARSRENGVGWVFHDPKSDTSKGREVPLVDDLARVLRKAQRAAVLRGEPLDGLIFKSSRGNPINKTTDLNRWYALLDKAGVERTPLHAARNSVADLLQNCGVDTVIVAAILGHADVSMTAHYQKGNRAGIIDAFEKLNTHMRNNNPGGAAA